MRLSSAGFNPETQEGEKRVLDSELWHACAGPLVSLPAVGSRVVYFPQGHSEQVPSSTNKEVDAHIPNYPSVPPQLICQLHNVTMHADVETDEVSARMTLQPLSPQEQKDAYLPELGTPSKQPTNYFCKTLAACDVLSYGGFSVPRRAAEKVFPPLDFSQQPPAQELIARDLHDNEWKFRHIFRGQPKRHLLTTGWSVFVSAKRLVAGDSVLFIWNEKNQLLLGIRRANRPQTVMPSSGLSSMHLGVLATAAHAAATNSQFTIFYKPRASPSEFVIPWSKYVKAIYYTRVSVGMRFRMLFETEESSVHRYMGMITGVSDLDSVRWQNSHWRSVKVGWDESTAGERQPRVSLWEIEPLTTFPMYPSPFPLRLKRPWPPGLPSFHGIKDEDLGINSPLLWLRDGDRGIQSMNFQGMGVMSWMQPRVDTSMLGLQTDMYQVMASNALHDMRAMDPSKASATSLLQFQQHQNLPSRTAALMPHQMLLQSQPQQAFLQNVQEHQNQSQAQKVDNAEGNIAMNDGNVMKYLRNDNDISWVCQFCGHPFRWEVQPQTFRHHLTMICKSVEDDVREAAAWFFEAECSRYGGSRTASTSVASNSVAQAGKEAEAETEGMSKLRGVGSDADSTTIPFSSSNYMSTAGTDFSLNPAMTPSGFIDESGFLQSPDNVGQVNAPTRTFVKVHKSGSFGRLLDITKFSSYNELRSELARIFGLEGQLEDPVRSGWQVVFVDRENDILLLSDDSWPEFVNSVWYIKILSPQEVQQMGKRGMD